MIIFSLVAISTAWTYTTPPDSIIDTSGFRFGNVSITSTGIYSDNMNTNEGYSYLIYTDGTTVYAKNGSTGNVKYRGTINTVWSNVISDITDNDLVIFNGGQYYPTSQMISTKSISIKGINNATFYWNSLSTYLFEFNGNFYDGGGNYLTNNASSTENMLTITNVTSILPGDLIFVQDNTIWSPTNYPTLKTGELHKVDSISGNNVTITDQLINSFNMLNGGVVFLIHPIKVDISGLNIVGNSTNATIYGIQLKYTTDSHIHECTISKIGGIGIEIATSYNTEIDHNVIYGSANTGLGYGIGSSYSSAYTQVHNNHISNCKHCITSGGTNGNTWGQTRKTSIYDNTLLSASNDVIAAHAPEESMYIYRNIITSSVGCMGVDAKRVYIQNNILKRCDGIRGGSVNNSIVVITDNIGSDMLYFWIGRSTDSFQLFDFSRNIMTGNSRYMVYLISTKLMAFNINDNYYNTSNTALSTDGAIYILSGVNGSIKGNTFNNAYNSAMFLSGLKNTQIQNNIFLNWNKAMSANVGAIDFWNGNNTGNSIKDNIFIGNTPVSTQSAINEFINPNTNTNYITQNDFRGISNIVNALNVGTNTIKNNNIGVYPFNFGNNATAPTAFGAGDTYFNTTSNIQQLYTGSSYDWLLMPSKVFGTGVTNNNNGSITISSILPQCPSSLVNGSMCLNYTTGAQNNYFDGSWRYTNGTII